MQGPLIADASGRRKPHQVWTALPARDMQQGAPTSIKQPKPRIKKNRSISPLPLEVPGKLGPVGNGSSRFCAKPSLPERKTARGAHQVAPPASTVPRLRSVRPASRQSTTCIEQGAPNVRAGNRDSPDVVTASGPFAAGYFCDRAGDVGVMGQAIERRGKGRVRNAWRSTRSERCSGGQIMAKATRPVAAGRAVHGIYRMAHVHLCCRRSR